MVMGMVGGEKVAAMRVAAEVVKAAVVGAVDRQQVHLVDMMAVLAMEEVAAAARARVAVERGSVAEARVTVAAVERGSVAEARVTVATVEAAAV